MTAIGGTVQSRPAGQGQPVALQPPPPPYAPRPHYAGTQGYRPPQPPLQQATHGYHQRQSGPQGYAGSHTTVVVLVKQRRMPTNSKWSRIRST